MALADAVQGARYIAQEITWTDEDGTAVDLTGATITGYKRNHATREVTEIDGTLSVVDAEGGVFSWAYGEDDVAEVGTYQVQFVATYASGLVEKTLLSPWIVHTALEITA